MLRFWVRARVVVGGCDSLRRDLAGARFEEMVSKRFYTRLKGVRVPATIKALSSRGASATSDRLSVSDRVLLGGLRGFSWLSDTERDRTSSRPSSWDRGTSESLVPWGLSSPPGFLETALGGRRLAALSFPTHRRPCTTCEAAPGIAQTQTFLWLRSDPQWYRPR